MSKVSKLLHISSGEEDSGHQNNNQSKVQPKIHTTSSLKFNTFKADTAQVKQNIFNSSSKIDEYVLPQQSKKKNINFVAENLFEIKNDTVIDNKKSDKDQEQDKSTRKLVQQLNKMNLTQVAGVDLQMKNLCQRRKSNMMMQFQLQEYSDQQQNSNIRVTNMRQQDKNQNSDNQQQQQQAQTQQKHSTDEKKKETAEQNKVREVQWDPSYQARQEFIQKRMENSQRLSVIIQRQKTGMNFFLPKFDMVSKKDLRHIITCKKQVGTSFQYIISTNNEVFSQKSVNYMGKIVGNFTNTVFNTFDCTNNLICTTKFRQQTSSKIAAPKIYDIFVLNQNQKYYELVGSNKQCTKGLDQLSLYPLNKKKISYFRNKKPQFNEKVQAYMLNFNGRVNKGSIKNFIIQDSKSGRQVLMFGRGPGQMFNLDISQPLSALLAFGIVIPHFASRMLQN